MPKNIILAASLPAPPDVLFDIYLDPKPPRRFPVTRPDSHEYASYYEKYVSLVPEHDILAVLKLQQGQMHDFLAGIAEADSCVRHPPYTWTVKQVVGHLTDSERIFAYRALRIARGDATPLAGFDENTYAESGQFDEIPISGLVEDFNAVRRASISLFGNLPLAAWPRRGTANNNEVSVRALAFIVAGHARHHLAILRQRLSRV
jgi:DinB superfamily